MYVNTNVNGTSKSYNYPALNIGASYRIGVVSLGVQYDVLFENSKSIYASAFSPVVRVFF